ncbi:MAG: ComEC/Rec2 family competence protein, partial [Deefgea sp.]
MLSRYLLFIASFVLGVIALQQQASLPPWWWALASACIALAVLRARHFVFQLIAIALLAASLGFAWAQWRAEIRMAQRIPSNLVGQTVLVEGYISGLPQTSRFGPRFVFTPEKSIVDGWQPQRIQVNASDKHGPFLAGERWRLMLKLKPIHGVVNPAGFDLESWFLQQNIAAVGSVKSVERLNEFSDAAWLLRIRAALRERIKQALPDAPYQGVIVALTIGDQGGIPKEQWQRFAQTGITHLISISGLHITLLA